MERKLKKPQVNYDYTFKFYNSRTNKFENKTLRFLGDILPDGRYKMLNVKTKVEARPPFTPKRFDYLFNMQLVEYKEYIPPTAPKQLSMLDATPRTSFAPTQPKPIKSKTVSEEKPITFEEFKTEMIKNVKSIDREYFDRIKEATGKTIQELIAEITSLESFANGSSGIFSNYEKVCRVCGIAL